MMWIRTVKTNFLFTMFFLLLSLNGFSTHLVGGEFKTEALSTSGHSYKILLILYTDDHSPVPTGSGSINFGDGSGDYDLTDVIESSSSELLQDGYSKNIFTINYNYGGSGQFIVNYREYNRSPNINNSANNPFSIQCLIIIDPFLGNNTSPELTNSPLFTATVGSVYVENPEAIDAEGDSLAFKLTVPLQGLEIEVENYQFPDHFLGPNGNGANEDGTGKPNFSIDITTGDLIWDAPVVSGQYIISYLIEEWRNIDGTWYPLGYTSRDYIISVEDVANKRPYLVIPDNANVIAGDIITATITGHDPDGDEITIESFGAPYNLAALPAEYSQQGNEVNFTWQTDPNQVLNQPYEVVFRVFDHPENGPVLYDYKIWRITVSTIASSVDKGEKGHLKIYPNPSSGIINVQSTFQGSGTFKISIFDLTGKLVFEKNAPSFSSLNIDLKDKTKGLYIIKFQGDKVYYTKKFVLLE